MTFPSLCAAMDVVGVEVRVALEEDAHVIRLVDYHRRRSLDVRVMLGFDREVTALCCSLALCADVPGITGRGPGLARVWPELAELARAAVDEQVSERADRKRLA